MTCPLCFLSTTYKEASLSLTLSLIFFLYFHFFYWYLSTRIAVDHDLGSIKLIELIELARIRYQSINSELNDKSNHH